MSQEGLPHVAMNGHNLIRDQRLAAMQGDHAKPWRATHPLGRYDRLTRLFHWVFACIIIYVSIAGYALGRIGNHATRDFVSHFNMSLATVLILLFPLRVLWKFMRVEPPPLPGVSRGQRKLAQGVHAVLYLTILAVLVSGFLMVPQGYAFFGYPIRTPFEQGPLTDALFLVHRISCAVLGSLVILHVLAVVKHQLIERRNVLGRML